MDIVKQFTTLQEIIETSKTTQLLNLVADKCDFTQEHGSTVMLVLNQCLEASSKQPLLQVKYVRIMALVA